MTNPVRLRAEVGERRTDTPTARTGLRLPHSDRRVSPSPRVDAIVAHFKAALAELQEQSRADRAEVAGLRAENERLREAVAKAARVIERKDADLIRYAAAGECEG